jgi:hypothetical protein
MSSNPSRVAHPALGPDPRVAWGRADPIIPAGGRNLRVPCARERRSRGRELPRDDGVRVNAPSTRVPHRCSPESVGRTLPGLGGRVARLVAPGSPIPTTPPLSPDDAPWLSGGELVAHTAYLHPRQSEVLLAQRIQVVFDSVPSVAQGRKDRLTPRSLRGGKASQPPGAQLDIEHRLGPKRNTDLVLGSKERLLPPSRSESPDGPGAGLRGSTFHPRAGR